MQSACLTAAELEALLKGNVVAADSARLDNHLSECSACRQKLNALAGGDESWLKLKQSVPVVPVDSPPLREAMNHLKAGDPMPPSEKPGDRIGRYKLLEQIGEGGCGVVYVAEQEEPFRRRVALKVIKLGMDTKQVIARFEAERQALAMMDHPNIAKVFDAGATEAPHPLPVGPGEGRGEGFLSAGRPYFVMELVRGVKITEYCDENKLDTARRLDLFIQVCQAVQHAHQKGIIHRDLKPSNILVTMNDSVPVPKVIDFGIAKATEGRLTDKTVYTQLHQFIGTPTYMSPEQALMTSLDIDTRSDIYSLGVLLYELLTGRTPLDTPALLKAGVDEMRRTIREVEPARPSTRLSILPREDLTKAAKRRSTNPPQLLHAISGDLDWIVMKCLEKDRTRRYDTANGLAMDIQRHLKNEPVAACPPSNLDRFQKMVRRNKLAFAAGSAMAASLVIGLTLATVFFFREQAARKRTDDQAAIAQAVNDFLQQDLLRQADSGSQAEEHFTPDPNLTVRQALERAAERIGERFKDQPLQEGAVRFAIGNAFRAVGQAERAILHLQRSLELARKLGPDHRTTLVAMNNLALAYLDADKLDQAVPLFEETLRLRQAKLRPDDRATLGTMNNLALAYRAAGKFDQALPLFEKTLTLMKATLSSDDPFRQTAMANLADCYREAGKLDQALELSEETLKLRKATRGIDHPQTLQSMYNLALVYRDAGKLDQALELNERTRKLRLARLGLDHPDTLQSMGWLADHYRIAGKLDQALPLAEETVKRTETRFGRDHKLTLGEMTTLALCYRDAGKLDQALLHFEETLKLRKARLGANNLDTLGAMHNLANVLAMGFKNYAEAETLYRDALNLFRPASSNAPPEEVPLLGIILHHLADVLREQKKLTAARPFAEEAMILYRRHADWPAGERRHALDVLQAVLRDLRDFRAIEALRPERMELLRAAAEKDDVVALNDLAWLLATSTDPAQRDGGSAVGFAEKAVANTQRKDPGILDTLAAAYAEAGEFAKAANVQREAIDLCKDEKTKNDLAVRLKLYESNTPFRE
jgi:serine/threonine protein kinase/lipopolysaccharide biosynthesis regulator YciM